MMRTERNGPIYLTLAAIAAFAVLAGCGPNERILNSAKEKPENINSKPVESSLDADIGTMRTAKFSHIYVIRRKDGAGLEQEDIKAIRLYSAKTNRRVMSDNDRAIVIGTNAPIPPPDLAALGDKFNVDTYLQDASAESNSNRAL